MLNTDQKLTGYPSIDKPWLKYYSKEALNTPLPRCKIYDYIFQLNKGRMDEYAINYFGKRYKYREMYENIEKTAKALAKIGVKEGDVVSLCMLTMPETIYLLYAINKIGAISNLIEPRTNSKRIAERIIESNSKHLIVVDVFLNKIIDIENSLNISKTVIVPIAQSMPLKTKMAFTVTKGRKIKKAPNSDRYIYWEKFISNGNNYSYKLSTYKENAPAAIIYTGGTTGISKGAILSNDCFTAMAVQAFHDAPSLFTQKRFLEIMPPFIAYGLIFGHFIPFCAGLENCLIPVFQPNKFVDYVLKYHPNHVVGVPAFFESLAKSDKLKGKKLDYLVSSITGGDKLLVNTETYINETYKRHNCKYAIMKGYGMTEMGSAVTFTACKECNVLGSVGIPCHYNNVKIINSETGEELKYNQQGELCLTGSTMMNGYLNNELETQKVMKKHNDGKIWIHTGDIGYINEDGIVFIIDRIKRMIIRPDGHNVYPSQIEEVICKSSLVKACAVVGLKNLDNQNGKIPTAFIVANNKTTDNHKMIEKIDKLCSDNLPERDKPMEYRIVNELPLTLIGKIDYRALENEAENPQ